MLYRMCKKKFFSGFFTHHLYKYCILIKKYSYTGHNERFRQRRDRMKKEDMPRDAVKTPEDRCAFTEKILGVVGELPGVIVSAGTNLDYAVDECLSRVGTLFSASRAYVMLDEKDGKYLRNTHEWVNHKIGPVMFSWPLYDYEYDLPSLKKIISEHDIFFGHSRDMPQDLGNVLNKQGVLSFIVSPLYRDGNKIGIVGIDFCEHECPHCQEYSSVLHCLAGLISLALERKQYHSMRAKLNTIKGCIDDLGPFIEGQEEDSAGTIRPNKPTTLLDAERRIIVETLELYNGNKLKTAKHLGLTWPSLDRRCKKLGIEVRRR